MYYGCSCLTCGSMAEKEAICSLTFSTLSTGVLLIGGLSTRLSKNLTTLVMPFNAVSIGFEVFKM